MYDELVKRLRNLSGTDNIVEFDEAADAVEELLQKMQQLPRWIPVTEKENLPNTDSGVVGYFGGGAFDQLRWYDFVCTLTDGSIVSENSERDVMNEHCIAVYKLPEPPKEDKP